MAPHYERGTLEGRIKTLEDNTFNTANAATLDDLVPLNQTIMDHESRIAAIEQGTPGPGPGPGPTITTATDTTTAAAVGGTGGPDGEAHFDSDFASDVYDGTINSPWTSSADHEATLVAPSAPRTGNGWTIDPTTVELIGWVNTHVSQDPNSDGQNHRLYPPGHVTLQTPVVISFLFFLDVNFAQLTNAEWVSLCTLDDSTSWSTTKAWSILGDGTPYWWGNGATWSGGTHSTDTIATKVWHRATFYADINTSGDSYFDWWIDGTKVSEVVTTNAWTSENINRMHFGLYTSTGVGGAGVDTALYRQTDIIIWRLAADLSIAARGDVGDTNTEPVLLV